MGLASGEPGRLAGLAGASPANPIGKPIVSLRAGQKCRPQVRFGQTGLAGHLVQQVQCVAAIIDKPDFAVAYRQQTEQSPSAGGTPSAVQ
jgi:hypothetical protein